MAKYLEIAAAVDAFRWRRTGDYPGDKPLIGGEGRIVKAYKRDTVHDDQKCKDCGSLMSAHGWLEPPTEPLHPDDAVVDPVSGKVVSPAAAKPVDPKAFPKVYAKTGHADVTVHNEAEEKQAHVDGFAQVPPPKVAAASTPAAAKPDKDRGDLKGLVVHPGYWIVKITKTNEKKVMSNDEFQLTYVKAP